MTDMKTDMALFAPRDVPAAIGLLTRIPVPVDHDAATARGARAVWAYPLAGLAVALMAGAVGGLSLALGLSTPFAAGLVLVTLVVITGAMHEDGLADCADGFWGGFEPARRLEIMKDSRIGAYGVIALVLGLLLRWIGIAALMDAGQLWAGLIVAATGSRAAMACVMTALPHARPGGLSATVGRPQPATALGAVAVTLIIMALIWPTAIPAAAAVVLVTALACAGIARAKIKGQTGDVLGGTQVITEIAVLAVLAGL